MQALKLGLEQVAVNTNKNIQFEAPDSKELNTMSPRPNSWTYEENKQYIIFLKENKRQFEDKQCRRFSKIYLEMSLNMQNKTPEQCRTHHKKALNKYKTVDNILGKLLKDARHKLEKKWQSGPQLIKESQDFKLFGSATNSFCIKLKFDLVHEF